ncbi:hypothetical protein HLI03_10345 [Rhizobium laguerreae]|uniref:hypothetical protein n=1 Tax=Rhizobium laguerreae TaxID=1076926 RepID=UPI001478DFA5|nr:hypothetical protein [Rhizobium laguerreae]NNH42059.1 hypothetical protein [Rhizobium laguerreae]NNH57269.1 hypothetical protein [Rhizobium laguerreae]
MDSQATFDDSVRTFVDNGTAALKGHHFVSEELNKKWPRTLTTLRATADGEPEVEGVQFRLNQTGNIFYSMSGRELQGETKKLFDSVTVLFAAMTKALASKNKTIFDYDAWGKIIAKSGYFTEVQKFQKTLSLKSGSVTIDTQVIQQLIPGLTSGSSLEIAKGVLNTLDGEFKKEAAVEKTKLAHILFICEELSALRVSPYVCSLLPRIAQGDDLHALPQDNLGFFRAIAGSQYLPVCLSSHDRQIRRHVRKLIEKLCGYVDG